MATVFQGSEKVELADKGDGFMLTARFRSVDELRALMQRFEKHGLIAK